MADSEDMNVRYFGYLVERTDDEQEPCRIRVETSGLFGRPKVLRHLPRDENDPFNWGYVGGGPIATAEAVLTDALRQPVSIHHAPPDKRLAHAFCHDIVAHLPQDEAWTLSRDAVLGWVRGWHVVKAPHLMPRGVKKIGDVDGAVEAPVRPWDDD